MGWVTATVRFERIPLTFRKTVKCADCGKRLKRQRTFEQTLNPWNRNAEGQPKSRQEILASLREQGAEWKQQPETCSTCLDGAA